jgi:hypothetical protein
MSRRRLPIRTNEVRVVDDDLTLFRSDVALEWLTDRNLEVYKDWDINMHGGKLGYTSFFFTDHRIAIEFKIVFV